MLRDPKKPNLTRASLEPLAGLPMARIIEATQGRCCQAAGGAFVRVTGHGMVSVVHCRVQALMYFERPA